MTVTLADRVRETSTTTGTGTLDLAGAVTGFVGFVAGAGDGSTVPYFVEAVDGDGVPTGDWEAGEGVVTDAATDTLSRATVLASSNSGSLVNFSAGTKNVYLGAPSSYVLSSHPSLAGGRLTLESGVPISTSDQAAKTTVYYTPHIHNQISLYDGVRWKPYTFSELSLAIGTLTDAKQYDVFVYDNSGTLTLELSAAWTNDTTRADALTTVEGVYVKSGATTRRYLGTFRTTSTTTTEDSESLRIFNANNRVWRTLYKEETTASWTYTTGNAWRSLNNSTANRVAVISGLAGVEIRLKAIVGSTHSIAYAAQCGIGIDKTNGNDALPTAVDYDTGQSIAFADLHYVSPAAAYQYFQAVEWTRGATATFWGTLRNANHQRFAGIYGAVKV